MAVAAPPAPPAKTHQLQGIRGLAALLVAVGHCLGLFATPVWFARLKDYSNGHAAVVMFFVLSGFVLTLSLRDRHDAPAEFYVKRLFRIYPAWTFACAVSLAYLALVHFRFPIDGGSDWWRGRFLPERFHPIYIAASFAGALAFLLPQGWTIFVELVASALMPLIAWTAMRRRGLFYGLAAVALILSLTIGVHTYYGLASYLIDFFLGAWLATPPSAFRKVIAAAEPWAIPSLVLAVAILIAFRNLVPASADLGKTGYNEGWVQGVEALCCVWILGVAVYGSRPLRWLDGKAITGLGEISYSFYLIHLPIMCLLANLVARLPMDPIWRSLTLLAVTLPPSLVASVLMYRWIERPGIALGRRLVGRLRRRTDPAAAQ
jgi:peptidoglycan/LPS O-acetylase OafA/YrhL